MPFSSPLPVELYDQICHYLVEDIGERELHLPTRRHEDSVVQAWDALKSLRLVDRNASKAATKLLFRQLRFPSLMEEEGGGVEADIKRLDGIKASPCLELVEEISLHLLQVWDHESYAWWRQLDEMPEGEALDVAEKQLSNHALFMAQLPPSRKLIITWNALIAGDEQQKAVTEKGSRIEMLTVMLHLLQTLGVEYDELVIEPGEKKVMNDGASVQKWRDDFTLVGRFSKYPHKDASCDAVLKLQGFTDDILHNNAVLRQAKRCSLIHGSGNGKGVVRHLILCQNIQISCGFEDTYDSGLTSLTLDENDHDFMTRLTKQKGGSIWNEPIRDEFGIFLEQISQTLTTVNVKPSFYYLFHYSPYLDSMISTTWNFLFDHLSRCPKLREVSIERLTYRRGRWARHICDHHPEITYLMSEETREKLEADMCETYGKSTLVLATLFLCDLRAMEALKAHLLRRAAEVSEGAATESLRSTADALGATCAVIRKAHEDGRLELLEIVPRENC